MLEVRDLSIGFDTDAGLVRIVESVSWSVTAGRALVIVGESGCGKSLSAMGVMGLIPQPPGRVLGGRVLFRDPAGDTTVGALDLLRADDRIMRSIRGRRIAMVFQDPMSALNPVLTVGEQIAEVIEHHEKASPKVARQRAAALLDDVGIADAAERVRWYPHQFSGGMRQRVLIAMAVACGPAVVIADEPTSALDATVRRQIIDLLGRLRRETGMALVIITHDLTVVARQADEICVMYSGRVVERGPATDVLDRPMHPYTAGLLRCVPRLGERLARLEVIPGSVPDASDPPSGCRFHPRCLMAVDRCRQPDDGEPVLRELAPGHFVACWEADAHRHDG